MCIQGSFCMKKKTPVASQASKQFKLESLKPSPFTLLASKHIKYWWCPLNIPRKSLMLTIINGFSIQFVKGTDAASHKKISTEVLLNLQNICDQEKCIILYQ